MTAAFRTVVLVALVLFGIATCGAVSNGGNTKWRFASVHSGQQSGKKPPR